MSFSIRPLLPEHEEAVQILVTALYARHHKLEGFHWPEETLAEEFRYGQGWGTFKGNTLVGFVLYRENPAAWEISVVASHPDYWGQGLMRSLLSHLIIVKPANKELWLEVHRENSGAWKLYESLGFQKVGERPNYYPGNGTAWLYSLR